MGSNSKQQQWQTRARNLVCKQTVIVLHGSGIGRYVVRNVMLATRSTAADPRERRFSKDTSNSIVPLRCYQTKIGSSPNKEDKSSGMSLEQGYRDSEDNDDMPEQENTENGPRSGRK